MRSAFVRPSLLRHLLPLHDLTYTQGFSLQFGVKELRENTFESHDSHHMVYYFFQSAASPAMPICKHPSLKQEFMIFTVRDSI